MARGLARAPSQNAYRGTLGRTQTRTVHVTGPRGDLIAAQVHTTIDAVTDPDLVERLHTDKLNTVHLDGAEVALAMPVVYHDPAAELMILVLGEAHRHREIDERIALYERMRTDDAAIPAYAKEFSVVYGASGLRAHLEKRAHDAMDQARTSEAMRDLERRGRELERKNVEHDLAKADLSARMAEIERMRVEIERVRSEARARVIAAAQAQGEATVISPPPRERDDLVTKPVGKHSLESLAAAVESAAPPPPITEPDHDARGNADSVPYDSRRPPTPTPLPPPLAVPDTGAFELDISTGVDNALLGGFDDEASATNIIPSGSDPLTTETTELPLATAPDAWLDDASARLESTTAVDGHVVRLVLVAGDRIARGLGGALDVRVLLHRTHAGAVVALVIGPPAAMRVPSPTQLAVIPLDIGTEHDRAVLQTLAKQFELVVDIVKRGHRVRRVALTAPLAENVAYILRAADDHLRGVASEGEPSFDRARDLVTGPGFDLLGTQHPEAGEFRDDKLAQAGTAQQLRRAIAMARRFARPSREDYLVCARGFPLSRWRELRRHVLESAVAWGLWMGPELAQVAVSEGLARSRRDLIAKLDRGFEALKRDEAAFDIDEGAVNDNAKALAEEARALGVELKSPRPQPANGSAMTSADASTVSGSIGGTPARGMPAPPTTDELLALLEDREQRMNAALALCERGEARAAAPTIAAVQKMSRAEAVRVLGMSIKFGEAAKGPLLEGLANSKAYLRHGCALALALLRTEDGTQAVIDLLLSEPTEIWREIARAIGQVGPQALMPLASNYGRLGDRAAPTAAERVAWAMAHVGVRGGGAAIEKMAGGQSVVAPVAKKALELLASAANDQTHVRPNGGGSHPGRDVTVNRAFSRRFFEALEQGIPEAAAAGLEALDASSPMEMLDESDLLEEEEAELDEADLIQS